MPLPSLSEPIVSPQYMKFAESQRGINLLLNACPNHKHPVPLGEYSPCNFRRWKRGDPRKLFLIELSRVLHGIPPMLGLDGGVGLGVPAGLSFGVWTGVPLGVGRGLPLGEG